MRRRAFLTLPIARTLAAQAEADFALPPKSVFDTSMPRYPNVWFLVDARIASTHEAAVKFVTNKLRTALHFPEYFPPFDNPEGCDFEVRIEHLQPWIDRALFKLQHAHSFHLRYYHTALAKAGLGQVTLARGGASRKFFRFAGSVHYEVEHANPHHADVEECPICGRTGEYASLKGNLVEQVHDPLGLELLLTGKVRGQAVYFEDWERRPFGGIQSIRDVRVATKVFDGQRDGRNTLRIGAVIFER